MNYGKTRNSAEKIIRKFGCGIELTSFEQVFNVETSDYENTETKKQTFGVFDRFTINDNQFGSGVLLSDLKIIMTTDVKPMVGDVLKRNGADYKIINVIEEMPADEVICYIAQARQ